MEQLFFSLVKYINLCASIAVYTLLNLMKPKKIWHEYDREGKTGNKHSSMKRGRKN